MSSSLSTRPADDPSPDPALFLTAEADPFPEQTPHPRPLPFAAPWTYELHFPCDPRSPGVARLTLRAVLAAHDLAELGDRAELLTTELATNSVRHTKGPAFVRLHWLCPVLRVSVWDGSPDLPPLVPPPAVGVHSDGGRGMVILDTVADRWGGCAIGGEPYGPGGKTVWFELSLPQAPPPAVVA
ncbi:ATP-binding protein [Streptomyces sp. NPDC006285]|uniref:ATP-binding protein n=1 Tax=Streptomyces sp. NPDC006285 TaxID=3364742 RepID=UPI0036A972C6